MPIYEYKCRKCGKEFEAFQRMSDPEVKTCKFCQGRVKRLISMTTFHLRGTGWYVTDYGGKKAPSTETEKENKAQSADSDSGKTEAASAPAKSSDKTE